MQAQGIFYNRLTFFGCHAYWLNVEYGILKYRAFKSF